MTGFAFAIGICALFGIGASAWFKIRTSRVARSRPDASLAQFINYFDELGISPEVPTAVYEYLSNLKWMGHFPVKPEDKLFEIYRLQGEELVDAYSFILAATQRQMPQSRYDALTIDTVKDLVLFFADLPKGPAS